MISELPDSMEVPTSRFLDSETTSTLQSLPALPLSDLPIVPFRSSIESLHHIFAALVQYADTSLDFAEILDNNPHNLTVDEIAAIHLYTSEWISNKEHSVYYVLNERLRNPDRSVMKPFLLYLRLLYSGLYKLTPYDCGKQRLWRGVKRVGDKMFDFKTNQLIRWWGFSSCTVDGNVLENFAGGEPVIFNVNTVRGYDINLYSAYRAEAEVLVVPPVQFKVTNIFVLNKVTTIEITEEPMHVSYLPCPTPVKDAALMSTLAAKQQAEEREKRAKQKAREKLKWNPDKKAACIILMNDNTTAKTIRSSCCDNNVIVAADEFTCGLNYYEMIYDVSGGMYDAVGVVNEKFSVAKGRASLDHSCWFYVPSGHVYHDNICKSYGSHWGAGNTIGILVTVQDKTVEFFVNGKSQGIAYNNVVGEKFSLAACLCHDGITMTICYAEILNVNK